MGGGGGCKVGIEEERCDQALQRSLDPNLEVVEAWILERSGRRKRKRKTSPGLRGLVYP